VKDGTELAIQPSDLSAPEMKARARVIRMSPIVDAASGTIEAVAEISGDSAGLRPGMTATLVLPKR
jgi:hypothetical protein